MRRRERAERGSMSAEIVILVPVVMMMVSFIVHVGRVHSASQFTRHVADVATRSGTRVADARSEHVARARAVQELSQRPAMCERFAVKVSVRERGGMRMLTTEVSCRTHLDGLSMLDVPTPTVRASSSEVMDRYRGAP